jgi:hypothetical protein
MEAVRWAFPNWRTYVSPDLSGSEYAATALIDALEGVVPLERDARLHLSTSMRSFRSEKVSAFVTALLDCDRDRAREMLRQVTERYLIVVTRDLTRAKDWVRAHARGSEQYGLVASSQAMRPKPHAIDVRVSVDPVQWFLGDPSDTRSSYYLDADLGLPLA